MTGTLVRAGAAGRAPSRRRHLLAAATGALLVALGSGCATQERGSIVREDSPPAAATPGASGPAPAPSVAGPGNGPVSSAGRPPSTTPPPGLPRPSSPPKNPTDLTSPGWVGGTVTTGGTGPCYGLVTDDGEAYALYSDQGWTLVEGTRIRALVEPNPLRIYCGPGRHVRLVKFANVG